MSDLLVRSRAAMLDALEALGPHRKSVIVIGAHAIYIRQPRSSTGLAPLTKDSDLAIDPRSLAASPRLEQAMQQAGFALDPESKQPGLWFREDGSEVDLMVPEAFAGVPGRRGVRIPPHDHRAARRARGLEGVLVDNDWLDVNALDPSDRRVIRARVAGPAALLVSKLFKLGERAESSPSRLEDKDAHDAFRILQGTDLLQLVHRHQSLLADDVSRDVAVQGLAYLDELFASGPTAVGSMMAGRAETGVGEPDIVSQQVAFLAREFLEALAAQSQ